MDVLRGLAIFGILTINAYYFSHPWSVDFNSFMEMMGVGAQVKPLDRVVHVIVFFFANDMLYSLFAFLFAFGMATLMLRAEACGAPFVRLYVRRLLVLFAFGVCHIVFFWAGDILNTYAILGFLLLAFRKRADSTLLAWAGLCLSITVIGFVVFAVLATIGDTATPAAAVQPAPAASASITPPTSTAGQTAECPAVARDRKWAIKTHDIYGHGTYWRILRWRLADFVVWTATLIFIEYPRVFGMFLLGLWAGRRGILHDVPAHLPFIRKVAVRGTIIGIVASLAAIIPRWPGDEELISPYWSGLIVLVGDAVRIPALCVAFAAAIVALVQHDAWRRRLSPLAAVGRMSLSNYLLQSVICSFIFYGCGLGLYGEVGPAGCLLIAVAVFLVQVPLSVLWLRHLRFGPAEWLWRTATYGRVQPMGLPDAMS